MTREEQIKVGDKFKCRDTKWEVMAIEHGRAHMQMVGFPDVPRRWWRLISPNLKRENKV